MKSSNKPLTLVILILLLFPMLLFSDQFDSSHFKNTVPKTSAEGVGQTLEYKDYHYESFTLKSQFGIEWSFSSRNPDVGILVIAMDKVNFQKYLLNQSDISFQILSDGSKTNDKRFFAPPYEGDWYVCFINDDPSKEASYVHTLYGLGFNTIPYWLIPLLSAVGLSVLIGISSIILKRRHKKLSDKFLGFLCFFYILLFVYLFLVAPIFNMSIYAFVKYPTNNTSGIWINSEDDFQRYGFKGTGTFEDPFILEGRTILTGDSMAIYIETTNSCVIIKNNILSSYYVPVSIDRFKGGYLEIVNNTFIGARPYNMHCRGIDLERCEGNTTIMKNYFMNFRIACDLYDTPQVSIENNQFLNIDCGIYLSYSPNATITKNSFDSKDRIFEDIFGMIELFVSPNCSIFHNRLQGNGIYITQSSYTGLNIINTTINDKECAFFQNLNDIIINSTVVYGQLFFLNCSEISIAKQNFIHTNIGLSLLNCFNVSISNSTIISTSYKGIYILNSMNFNITNCIFYDNLLAVESSRSNQINIFDNEFYNNFLGILSYLSNCSYIDNSFVNNSINWHIVS